MRRTHDGRVVRLLWGSLTLVAGLAVVSHLHCAPVVNPPCVSTFIVPNATGNTLVPPNTRPVPVLSQMDIDANGVPDGAPDSDGDGLPDNWEVTGGINDTSFVGFFAPTAIGPGTPPTFLTARLVITTDANKADTDGDGMTDFIEVLGLKFIDDNRNGQLDFIFTDTNPNGRWDPGEPIDPRSEWLDLNGDGLPSIGESPLANIDPSRHREHDFDGFVFTDPTNSDTDGDGICDGLDPDPLINPQTFGVSLATGFDRPNANPNDDDVDNDGLGNGSDFGNDLIKQVDFPTDLVTLLDLFRKDRIAAGTLPESLIEDLLGADWDGNGLFRITDAKDFARPPLGTQVDVNGHDCFFNSLGDLQNRFAELFLVGPNKLFGEFPTDAAGTCQAAPSLGGDGVATDYATLRRGIGFQKILLPASRSGSTFPDVRVWTILYAWRMPGFDIDGDGFMGSPETRFAVDDLHRFLVQEKQPDLTLDGRIEVPSQYKCGTAGLLFGVTVMLSAFAVARVKPPWRRHRRT